MKSDYRHDGDLEMNAKANAVDEQEVSKHNFKSIATSSRKNGGDLKRKNDSPNNKKQKTAMKILEDFGKFPKTPKKRKGSPNKKTPKTANELGDLDNLIETPNKRQASPKKKSPQTAMEKKAMDKPDKVLVRKTKLEDCSDASPVVRRRKTRQATAQHLQNATIPTDKMGKPFGFMNPGHVSPSRVENALKTRITRTQAIANRLAKARPSQFIFIPYNLGAHWILVVIDVATKTGYFMDLEGNSPAEDIKELVIK
ncbi:hypothetical protein WN943_003976 [Citrus x changshan-huyou]